MDQEQDETSENNPDEYEEGNDEMLYVKLLRLIKCE